MMHMTTNESLTAKALRSLGIFATEADSGVRIDRNTIRVTRGSGAVQVLRRDVIDGRYQVSPTETRYTR